ncbi:MAG: NUDIX domain-containing protein [Micavibrio sp.]|nr:NUDIX domain-containing protein [Micavibrio sp.]
MSDNIYMDKWGKPREWSAEIPRRPRSGVFAICIHDNKILLSWPNNTPDVPELPGGGIDEGEGIEQALIRELEEEAAVTLDMQDTPVQRLTQNVKFYADFDGECWDYKQTYLRLSERDAASVYFEGKRTPEDARKSAWIALEKLGSFNLHAIHAKALEEFL